jgi:hypothetical protein
VIGNSVHDIGPAGCKHIQGIYISTSGTVTHNLVYRIAAAGIHLWHDAHKVVIANNTVTTSDTGIIVGGATSTSLPVRPITWLSTTISCTTTPQAFRSKVRPDFTIPTATTWWSRTASTGR